MYMERCLANGNIKLMSDSLTKRTIKSSIWSVIDIILRQGIGFVVSVILARLLTPSDYGTIGLIMIFITLSNVFVDSGFSSGLIRKIDRTEEDLSTAFIFNIFVAVFIYFLLYISAPYISSFFDNLSLTLLLRVLGLVLIINSLNLVQNAILIFSMRIKQLAIITSISQITTGIIAIFLAYCGYGVWALVLQQLFAASIQTILLIIFTRWHPHIVFDKDSFRYLWGYGSKLLCANFIGSIFDQAYSFIIGKYLGKKELGLYSRSDQFAQQPCSIITNVISKALVPSLANCQNDIEKLKCNYIKCIEAISFIIFPLMFLLSFIAQPLFSVLFGNKWISAVPLFQILCIGYSMNIFSNLSLQLIQVMGRTDYTLKLEFFKKPIFAIIILISFLGGLHGIVLGHAFYCFVAAMINLSVVKALLNYGYVRQVLDIFKYAFLALLIIIFVDFCVSMVIESNILIIVLDCFFSILGYLLLGKITHIRVFSYLKDIGILKR